jgi:hypothetical protein
MLPGLTLGEPAKIDWPRDQFLGLGISIPIAAIRFDA